MVEAKHFELVIAKNRLVVKEINRRKITTVEVEDSGALWLQKCSTICEWSKNVPLFSIVSLSVSGVDIAELLGF